LKLNRTKRNSFYLTQYQLCYKIEVEFEFMFNFLKLSKSQIEISFWFF